MKMNYVTLGTNNMVAATNFYDALFNEAKLNKFPASERMTYWLGEDFAFAIATPFNGEAASNGNGTMVGFAFESTKEVTDMYNKAIELGGTCEGEPNQRGPKFSAYIRDLDKNKICFSN